MLADHKGVISEYEIIPRSKIHLTDMLDIVAEKLKLLATDDTVDCGFKVW